MLSAGGCGTGAFWSHIPFNRAHCIDDAHLRVMFLQRLDCLRFPDGLLCAMPKADKDVTADPERCGQPMDARGLHLHNCPVGTRRFRPHNSVVAKLGRLLKLSGAHVDLERSCPELYREHVEPDGSRRVREAVLDVVALFSGSCMQRKIDVTIRSPFSQACMNARTVRPGLAASNGEKAKASRYGNTVLPLSFESLGRLGPGSLETITALRMDARMLGRAFFSATGSVCDWRRQLETVLLYELADAALLCMGRCGR